LKQLVWNVSITFELVATGPDQMLERLREILKEFPQPISNLTSSERPRFEFDLDR
jgi:hypothetical protein